MTTAQLSNLDATRRTSVAKGCVVSFGGISTCRVTRVRLGYFWTSFAMRPYRCSEVTVIAK